MLHLKNILNLFKPDLRRSYIFQPLLIFLLPSFKISDTHEERDYLIANIYPKLKDYCKLNYGVDFQVGFLVTLIKSINCLKLFKKIIDMRWGVPHEASNNHMTTSLSLDEVKNCQNLSLGPNF